MDILRCWWVDICAQIMYVYIRYISIYWPILAMFAKVPEVKCESAKTSELYTASASEPMYQMSNVLDCSWSFENLVLQDEGSIEVRPLCLGVFLCGPPCRIAVCNKSLLASKSHRGRAPNFSPCPTRWGESANTNVEVSQQPCRSQPARIANIGVRQQSERKTACPALTVVAGIPSMRATTTLPTPPRSALHSADHVWKMTWHRHTAKKKPYRA